jgi:hypothetical protein
MISRAGVADKTTKVGVRVEGLLRSRRYAIANVQPQGLKPHHGSPPHVVETSIAAAHTRTLLDGRLATRPDSGTDEDNLRSRQLS